MKAKLLTLFSLLALLLVSTSVLADGRPTGIRIGRAVSGGGANVEIDVTVTGTNAYNGGFTTTVWIGNQVPWGDAWQYASPWTSVNGADPLPWAIEWGDGYYVNSAILFGSSGGPYRSSFAHTYLVPGTYTIVAGDFVGTQSPNPFPVNTGNPIYVNNRYIYATFDTSTFAATDSIVAITNTASVTTGTGIPTLNIYGLLAMAFVLVGTGVLLFRKPAAA